MSLGMELRLGPSNFVLDGDPLPPKKRGRTPKFSAHVYWDQTAGYIKMVLGTEVGLTPGDFVLDGDPAHPINFRPLFIVAALWKLFHRAATAAAHWMSTTLRHMVWP